MYTNPKVEELRNNLTRQVIESLEAGAPLWRKPWSLGPNAGAPAAASTKKAYRGGNAMILGMLTSTESYSSRWWNTFNNWAKLGCFPKKGSTGTWCQYLENKTVKDKETDKNKKLFIYKAFVLFNAEQCHDAKDAGTLDRYLCHENEEISKVSYECVNKLIAEHGIKVRTGGNSAHYIPGADIIQMPKKGFYETPEAYYATLLHEITHWAQHHHGGRVAAHGGINDSVYSDGELSAELGSVFLMKELGLPYGESAQIANHAGYLKYWLNQAKQDNKYIFKCASEAGKLVDFLVGNKVEEVEEELATV